jgi:hypothetical protein
MGKISERTHSLAEDVKLSAHGRHPTAYLFTSCCFIVALKLFLFLFSKFLLLLCFQGQKGTSVQVWGYARSHASPNSSSSPKSALSMYLHIGDNVQFKFGGMGDTFTHTLSHFNLKKKKKNTCSCCLEILVDLRIMI